MPDYSVPYPYASSLADAKKMADQGINYPGAWAGWSDRMYAYREIRNNLISAVVLNESAPPGAPKQMWDQYEWDDGRILTAGDFASVASIKSFFPEIGDVPSTDVIDVDYLKAQAHASAAAGTDTTARQEAREQLGRERLGMPIDPARNEERKDEAAAAAAAMQQTPVLPGGSGGLSQGRTPYDPSTDPDPSRRLADAAPIAIAPTHPILLSPVTPPTPAPVSTTRAPFASSSAPTAATAAAAAAAPADGAPTIAPAGRTMFWGIGAAVALLALAWWSSQGNSEAA